MNRYQDKICLITASSTGIGFAIAQRMAKEGGTVIISSRNKEHVEKAVKIITDSGHKAVGFPCHVGNKSHRENLLKFVKEKFGRIDVLVPNAAVSTFFGNQFEITEAAMDKMYEINIKSTFFLIKEALPLMEGVKGANILIVTSYAAYEPDMTISFYSVTKTTLLGMMKTIAKGLYADNIRVNCVAPGLIKTKFSKELWDGREKETKELIGVNRLGEVEDIANAAAFLCSYEADYITGETLPVVGKPLSRL